MLPGELSVGDVINLNRWRKEARRKAEAAAADESAIRNGRTKAQRRGDAEAERLEAERHDAHRLEGPTEDPDEADGDGEDDGSAPG